MDISNLPILWISIIFIVAATVVWIAGVYLSNTTDTISKKLNIGQALGGIIILAIVTNLPELVITISAAIKGNPALAIGNILGGIAMQTLVLVLFDVVGIHGNKTLMSSSKNGINLVLQAVLVIAMLSVVIMGHQFPSSVIFWRFTPASIMLLLCWIAGVYVINYARSHNKWQLKKQVKTVSNRQVRQSRLKEGAPEFSSKTLVVFLVSIIATLAAGVFLELSSDGIAKHLHMQGVIFGATILAAATSLPEVSTGLASLKIKAYRLAISDIFGGNAFLPVLLALLTFLSGKPILPQAHKSDIYLSALGITMTAVYIGGIVIQPKRKVLAMGLDSLFVLLVYLIGAAGLLMIKD